MNMTVRKPLILKLFSAFYMQRWNDRMRPMSFIEMDKQAHKMIIAWFLGKFEEGKSGFSWTEIIEGGIFELFQRIILTDIKPPVFYRLKADPEKYRMLNLYVLNELKPVLTPLGNDFINRFQSYFENSDDTPAKRILSAAHVTASQWEYTMIERINPDNYDSEMIRKDFIRRRELYHDLEGMKEIALHDSYRSFIHLCGQLRFQERWAQLHRIPKTSVLGHSLFVAMTSYLFSLEAGACSSRCYNNYFSGLFHDLPEVLTRDIISPIKRSIEGLSGMIKDIEIEMMEQVIKPLLPAGLYTEIADYAENEFENLVWRDDRRISVKSEEIQSLYNLDEFNPRDGELVKACDELSAFIEALVAIKNNCSSEEFSRARNYIRDKYESKVIAGIHFNEIYADFRDFI